MASARSCLVTLVNMVISLSAGTDADGVLFPVSLFVAIFVAFFMVDRTKIGNLLFVCYKNRLFVLY